MMMKVQSPVFVQGPQSLQGPHRATTSQASATQSAAPSSSLAETDQLDISPAGNLASRSLDASSIRQDRVAQIRAAIQAGTYETDDKLNAAVDRLMDQLG